MGSWEKIERILGKTRKFRDKKVKKRGGKRPKTRRFWIRKKERSRPVAPHFKKIYTDIVETDIPQPHSSHTGGGDPPQPPAISQLRQIPNMGINAYVDYLDNTGEGNIQKPFLDNSTSDPNAKKVDKETVADSKEPEKQLYDVHLENIIPERNSKKSVNDFLKNMLSDANTKWERKNINQVEISLPQDP